MSSYSPTFLSETDNLVAALNSNPELKNWLKDYTPDPRMGFMWSSHPNIFRIHSLVEDDGHSGASFALCLRNVQKIIKQNAQ